MTDGKTRNLRVLVCGGRDYADSAMAFEIMDWIKLHWGVAAIIHGGQTGADSIGANWAEYRDVPAEAFPADWAQGKSAGPIRNQRMIDEGKPDLVVAFPGGRGTADMVGRAQRAKIKVMEIPA